jgi:hypothetical protein
VPCSETRIREIQSIVAHSFRGCPGGAQSDRSAEPRHRVRRRHSNAMSRVWAVSTLALMALALLMSTAHAQTCQATLSDGSIVDLSSLANQDWSYQDTAKNYLYVISVCGQSKKTCGSLFSPLKGTSCLSILTRCVMCMHVHQRDCCVIDSNCDLICLSCRGCASASMCQWYSTSTVGTMMISNWATDNPAMSWISTPLFEMLRLP